MAKTENKTDLKKALQILINREGDEYADLVKKAAKGMNYHDKLARRNPDGSVSETINPMTPEDYVIASLQKSIEQYIVKGWTAMREEEGRTKAAQEIGDFKL